MRNESSEYMKLKYQLSAQRKERNEVSNSKNKQNTYEETMLQQENRDALG